MLITITEPVYKRHENCVQFSQTEDEDQESVGILFPPGSLWRLGSKR